MLITFNAVPGAKILTTLKGEVVQPPSTQPPHFNLSPYQAYLLAVLDGSHEINKDLCRQNTNKIVLKIFLDFLPLNYF